MTEYSPELPDRDAEPHWSNCAAHDGGECNCRKYGVPPSARTGNPEHGRGCIGTCCLPDTWAMGTADYASAKRLVWM